jgi:spermidine synthase
MTSQLRAALFTLAVFAAFFASGAACLVSEVTWNRMLIVVVGNSLSATALIVAVFMGGLGLGSFLAGRFLSGKRVGLLPYVGLEILVGVYVLFSPVLLGLLAHGFTGLAETIDNPAAVNAVRIAVTLAALAVPAVLMGATFPAILAGTVAGSPSSLTARTGYLYSVNTLGAAVGCFAAGYHLLFEFGVRTTLGVAAGLYLTAVLCALAARALAVAREEEAPPAAVERTRVDPGLRRFLYAATFGVGFAVLAYEVLLTRLSILYLGNSVSVFPLVLTGFLLGTGVSAVAGTWGYGLVERRWGNTRGFFGVIALLAAGLVLATPYLLLTDWVLGPEQFARFADAQRRNPLPILGIIIAPTVLLGALLPVAIRMLRPSGRGETTREASGLYAVNTLGGLIGAAVANHVLVPEIGVQGVTLLLTVICAGVGLYELLRPGRMVFRWGALVAGTAAGVLLLAVALPDTVDLYAAKVAASTRAERAEVLHVEEGRAATVTVVDQFDPARGSYRDMYLNGVEEASTRYWHVQLFKLLGILPVLLHDSPGPKEALVIAFGAGITAGSVLASDRVASLDVVDLNPDIEGINDLFTEVNGDVFHESRFRFHNDDGRSHLVTGAKRYDLIIGDSTHPRAYDSWILYTEEFYRLAARRLLPGGVFAQWVPVLGSMQGDLFRIHLNTFRTVFPHATLWYVYGSDQAFLLGTPEPFGMDAWALQEELDRLPGWFRAEEYGLDTAVRMAGFFWQDPAMLDRMIGDETRINRDDLHYFDKQSAIWPAPPQERLPHFQAPIHPHVRNAGSEIVRAMRDEQAVARDMARYAFFQNENDLFAAYCADPGNGNARYFMERRFAGHLPDPETFCADLEIGRHRRLAEAHPDDSIMLNGLADALGRADRLDEAVLVARRAAELAPGNGMVLDTYGWILHRRGETARALEVLGEADRRLPDHPIVNYHLGAAHAQAEQPERARRHLLRALEISTAFEGVQEARRLLIRLE